MNRNGSRSSISSAMRSRPITSPIAPAARRARRFFTAVERIFHAGRARSAECWQRQFAHFAPSLARVCGELGISRETTARLFFFNHLRGVLAAAVRLNIVGPMEAQMLQHRLVATAEDVLNRCAPLTLDDIAQTAPLLDLWQGAQDRLYSRLFQS